MCKSDQVRKTVLAELNATGKKAGLKPLEQLQTLILDPVEWTPQSGMLTGECSLLDASPSPSARDFAALGGVCNGG